jgi:ribonuclease T2
MEFRKNSVFLIFLTGLTILFAQPACADKVRGIFSAQQSCPAFVSKNKLANPGNAKILTGNRYDIIEVTKPNPPAWYRIVMPGVNPEARWVSAACDRSRNRSYCTGKSQNPGKAKNYCVGKSTGRN